jgi:hypothetical protein
LTLAGTISLFIQNQWSLQGDASTNNIVFDAGKWYDGTKIKPQIHVNDGPEPIGCYFGGSIKHSYAQYNVNVWVPIPRGGLGTAEAETAEAMKYEVSRIIMANHDSIAPFINIVPTDNGVPLHEIDGPTPRILRYQIRLKGALEK